MNKPHQVEYLKLNKRSFLLLRADMYISILRSYIEAMGGELDIIARFPEGEVHIYQFKDIGEEQRQ